MTKMINKAEIIAKRQRSHTLLIFSSADKNQKISYERWLKSDSLKNLGGYENILAAKAYKLSPITVGGHKPPGFEYLTLVQLNLDGAEDIRYLMKKIHMIFQEQRLSKDIATWLYYPLSEKVGIHRDAPSPYLTIAYANAIGGREAEFREWYVTQHIRHALIIPSLISGQCFELTDFQMPKDLFSEYKIIAIYEQDSTPEEMIESMSDIDLNKLAWSPSGDAGRFTECFYEAM